MFFLQILKITGRYFFLTRIDLKGKVEEMIPETLKSIIWQNYLSSSGDDVRNGILTFSSSIAFVPAIRDRLDGRWLSRFICELATSEERLGELHLCRGGEHLDQPLWQGEAKNFWKKLFQLSKLSKVDAAYMESCTGTSDSTMQKFCNFAKEVLSKKNEIERSSWFSEWQTINTVEEEIPSKRWFFLFFMKEIKAT